jgi:hypothetical protein
LCTTSPPFCAVTAAERRAGSPARRAPRSASPCVVNSSSVEAVSSSELACSSVRLARLWLPAATWPAPTAMDSAPERIW